MRLRCCFTVSFACCCRVCRTTSPRSSRTTSQPDRAVTDDRPPHSVCASDLSRTKRASTHPAEYDEHLFGSSQIMPGLPRSSSVPNSSSGGCPSSSTIVISASIAFGPAIMVALMLSCAACAVLLFADSQWKITALCSAGSNLLSAFKLALTLSIASDQR